MEKKDGQPATAFRISERNNASRREEQSSNVNGARAEKAAELRKTAVRRGCAGRSARGGAGTAKKEVVVTAVCGGGGAAAGDDS